MNAIAPHYLLLSEAGDCQATGRSRLHVRRHHWRFVLEATDGSAVIEAEDEESDEDVERLELLALVRGLEALDQPSRVTLVTTSLYVSQGLLFGIEEWRENDWQWEKFGELVPIKNRDLWRRVDHALRFHQVECRMWRVDRSHVTCREPLRALREGADRMGTAVVDSNETGTPAQATQTPSRGDGVPAPHFAARPSPSTRLPVHNRRLVPAWQDVEPDEWLDRHPEIEATLPRAARRRRRSPLAIARASRRPADESLAEHQVRDEQNQASVEAAQGAAAQWEATSGEPVGVAEASSSAEAGWERGLAQVRRWCRRMKRRIRVADVFRSRERDE